MNLDRLIAVRNDKNVYRDGRKCLKAFAGTYTKSDLLREAFNQEVLIEAGLNVPRVDSVSKIGDKWMIVSEYIRGKSLSQRIAEEPERVMAFLEAEIRGWQDALADPAEGARLAVEEYGADLQLDMAKELEQSEVQAGLIVTPDVEANGLFTITDELIEQNMATLEAAGIDIAAEDLFDLSLLEQLLEEKPELTELPA